MHMMRFLVAMGLAGATLTACGSLIDPDVAGIDLSLSSQEFAVDTEALSAQDAAAVTSTPCSGQPSACSDAAAAACPNGQCTASCNEVTGTCDVTLKVVLYRTVDLAQERPELAELDANAFVSVEIKALQYQIADNSLNIATPVFSLDVAPATVTNPDTPESLLVATVPSTPPMTAVAITDMETSADGLAHLSDAMLDFRMPFQLILSGTIEVTSQTPIPDGSATARVLISATAHL